MHTNFDEEIEKTEPHSVIDYIVGILVGVILVSLFWGIYVFTAFLCL